MWKPGFPYYGKRFLVLAMSLQEYEYYITQIKKRFETDMQLDADSSKPAMPVILSGIVYGQKLGTSADAGICRVSGIIIYAKWNDRGDTG